MKVLLAGPDFEENLSIRYLSGALLNAGYETILVPFNSAEDATAVADAAQEAAIVGLSMCFQSRAREFLDLARLIKSRDPKKLVVAGGHYASCAAEALLANHPELDIVVIHEGEGTLVEIAGAMPHLTESLSRISGIAYRDGQQVRFTTPRRTLDDLDALPFPDRRGPVHTIAGVPTSYLMGSRGCYSSCAYCCITTLHRMAPGKRFRQRNAECIADEMAALYRERSARQFIFHDDNFLVPSEALNHARVSAFEKALKIRRLVDIAFVIKCRPADASREIFRRLKDLGLVRVFLGIESATERGLSSLERDQSVEDSERALEVCSELDISAQFTLMTFNPDATLETLRSDVAFMRRFSGNPLNFCRAEIYAGTPLEKRMIELGRARGNYLARVYSLSDPVADLACEIALDLFEARCWSNGSLMQNTIGLDHTAAVAKRFYPGSKEGRLCGRVARWVRGVNLDTINLLEEVIECSASGGAGAAMQRAIRSLKEREVATRQQLVAEGIRLSSELQQLRLADTKRGVTSQAQPTRLRFARQAAVAVLALATSGCHQGVSEMAPPPLKQGQTQPPPPGADQESSCTILGTITDASGAVITHATITVTNQDTGRAQVVTTDVGGGYLAKDLRAGNYSVKAEAQNFKTTVVQHIVLKVRESHRADIRLEIGNWGGCCEYAAPPLKEDIKPLLLPSNTGQHELTGSVVGIVTDPQGATVQNATITITNSDTGLARTLTTNVEGHYSASDVKAGHYTVKVQASGFSIAEMEVVVQAAGQGHADFVLKVARADSTVDVEGESVNNWGVSEYAATPLKVEEEDLYLKKKPFTYVVGDAKDHNTFQGIANLVYEDRKLWVQIFEANRNVIEKPGVIPNGTSIVIPPRMRDVPKLISKVQPVYPSEAKTAQVWGDVVLDVTLKDDGSVAQVSVIDGSAQLVESATTAVKQWRYRPSAAKRKPAKLSFVVVVSFGKSGKIQ